MTDVAIEVAIVNAVQGMAMAGTARVAMTIEDHRVEGIRIGVTMGLPEVDKGTEAASQTGGVAQTGDTLIAGGAIPVFPSLYNMFASRSTVLETYSW